MRKGLSNSPVLLLGVVFQPRPTEIKILGAPFLGHIHTVNQILKVHDSLRFEQALCEQLEFRVGDSRLTLLAFFRVAVGTVLEYRRDPEEIIDSFQCEARIGVNQAPWLRHHFGPRAVLLVERCYGK